MRAPVAPPAPVAGPDARPGTPSGRVATALRVVGATLVLTALGVARLVAGGSRLDTVWAEDGRVFLGAASRRGPLDTVTTTYEGYLHVVPRLLVAPLVRLPAGPAPVGLVVLGALATALLAVFVYHSAAPWLVPAPARVLLAGSMVLLPSLGAEVVGNVANVQWALGFAAFWALVDAGDRPGLRRVGVAVGVLAALSSPVALVLLPIGVVLVASRRGAGRVVPLAFTAAAGLQLLAMAGARGERTIRSGVHDPGRVVRLYGQRVVEGPLHWVPQPEATAARWVLVLAVVVLAGTIAARRGVVPATAWRRAGLLTACSVATFVVPTWTSDVAPRYAAAPAWFLLAAFLVVVSGSPAILRAAAVVLVVAWVAAFPATGDRVGGPAWGHGVDAAVATCRSAPTARVPLAPRLPDGRPWGHAVLDCDYLTG